MRLMFGSRTIFAPAASSCFRCASRRTSLRRPENLASVLEGALRGTARRVHVTPTPRGPSVGISGVACKQELPRSQRDLVGWWSTYWTGRSTRAPNRICATVPGWTPICGLSQRSGANNGSILTRDTLGQCGTQLGHGSSLRTAPSALDRDELQSTESRLWPWITAVTEHSADTQKAETISGEVGSQCPSLPVGD